jgi:hypothetical protein
LDVSESLNLGKVGCLVVAHEEAAQTRQYIEVVEALDEVLVQAEILELHPLIEGRTW